MQVVLKIAVVLCLLFSFSSIAFALSSIVVENATPAEVRSFLIENMSRLGKNASIENLTDSSITFIMIDPTVRQSGWTVTQDSELKETFTFTPSGSGTLLTFNAIGSSRTVDGQIIRAPLPPSQIDTLMLEGVKLHFDGGYLHGFLLSPQKQGDGYPIIQILPYSPAEKAGLKIGDVITKVNGVKLEYVASKGGFNFQTTVQKSEQLILTVKAGKLESERSVISQLFDAKTQQFRAPLS